MNQEIEPVQQQNTDQRKDSVEEVNDETDVEIMSDDDEDYVQE